MASMPRSRTRPALAACRHLVCTLWLFIVSDVKSIVVLSTVFAVSMIVEMAGEETEIFHSLQILTAAVFWIMINLLDFSISNQKQPDSIREDSLNKPWRPLPSKWVTQAEARLLGRFAVVAALIVPNLLGGGQTERVVLALLTHMYNNWQHGSRHWALRNLINALDFSAFASGALSVALQSPLPSRAVLWLAETTVIIATTQVQDLYDQDGDREIGPSTLPLVFGDRPTRLTIAAAVVLWSVVAPRAQSIPWTGAGVIRGLGLYIAVRVRAKRWEKTISGPSSCTALGSLLSMLCRVWQVFIKWEGG